MALEVVFLDRDGTLNVERDEWLTRPKQLELLPGAAAAVARLNAAGMWVVVVTNQSAIARGLLDDDGLAAIHERLADLLLESGAWLDAVLVCPHGPDDDCDCRKPRPGLLQWAAREMGFDLGAAVMVGDAERDLAAGRAAGCAATILVRSGQGAAAEADLAGTEAAPTVVVDDLAAAVDWILERCAC